MNYLLVLNFVFITLISPVALRPHPSGNTFTVSMYDMCLESDIRQIEELKDSLLEDFNRTSPNFEELKQLQPFGLLDEDWKRLRLLESRLPERSLLKSKLLIVFRILIAAIYQAYDQNSINSDIELDRVNNRQNIIEQEMNNFPKESLDYGESNSDSVIVKDFTQDISSVDFSEETATTNKYNLSKYGEKTTSKDSIILPISHSNNYFENENRSSDREETGIFTEASEKSPSRIPLGEENINGSNNSFSESVLLNSLNNLTKESNSPVIDEAVNNGSYPSSQNSNVISNHLNKTADSFENNQVFDWTDETNFSVTTIFNELRENMYIDEDDRPKIGDSNSSESENSIDKSLQETTIGDATEAASDSIYSYLNFSNFNNQPSKTSSQEVVALDSITRYNYTSRDSLNKEENFVRYKNDTMSNSPQKPAKDSVTSTDLQTKQESEDSHEPSDNPFDTTSDSVTPTGSSVKQESHIGDYHKPSNNPFATTSDIVTSTGSSLKQESQIGDNLEPSNNPFDLASNVKPQTDSPVKQEYQLGDFQERFNNPSDTLSEIITSKSSLEPQESHTKDSHETFTNPYGTISDSITSTSTLEPRESHIMDSGETSNKPPNSIIYSVTSTGSPVKQESHIGENHDPSNNPFDLVNDGFTLTDSPLKPESQLGDIQDRFKNPLVILSDSFTSLDPPVKQESHLESSQETSNNLYDTISNSVTSTDSPLTQEYHIRDSHEHYYNTFETEVDSVTSTGSPAKQEVHVGENNDPSNNPFDTTNEGFAFSDSPVKQESYVEDSQEPFSNKFDLTIDSVNSTGLSVKHESYKGDSNEPFNTPDNLASDTYISTVNLTEDSTLNSQAFDWTNESESPNTSAVSDIQEDIHEENRIVPNSFEDRFKSKELDDISDQTSLETEIAHPTAAASGVIYSFVNFSNFRNQQSNENSNEKEHFGSKTELISRVSTPVHQENFVRDSDTSSTNMYDPASETIKPTVLPAVTNGYILNSFQRSNKPLISEEENTFGSEATRTTSEQQDLSEEDAESPGGKNIGHYLNHKGLNLSKFDAFDLNAYQHNQSNYSLETSTPIVLQENSLSRDSNLMEVFKNTYFGFSENTDGSNLERNKSNNNLLLTTPSYDLVKSIEDFIGNQYLGSYHHDTIQQSTPFPLEISSETVYYKLDFVGITEVSEDKYEKHQPTYTSVADTATTNFKNNLFNLKDPGGLNQEIDSKDLNRNEMLTVENKNKQRSSVEEQEFDLYDNNETKNDIKYSPGDQEKNLSLDDERRNNSSKNEEKVTNKHGEKYEIDTLSGNKTSFSREENINKYNTYHNEKTINASKTFGLNKYQDLSKSNEDYISKEENITLQIRNEEHKIDPQTNSGEHINDSKLQADSREPILSKEEGNEANSGSGNEYSSESNVEENYRSRTTNNPSSSIEDTIIKSESLEDYEINPTSGDKSTSIQPRLPDQTNSQSENTESTVFELDSSLTKEPPETLIRKLSYALTESYEPFVNITKANGEKHSDDESKENQTLLEPLLHLEQQAITDQGLIHSGTYDVIDQAESDTSNSTWIKPVDEGKQSETETLHSSFRTFSMVLPETQENHQTTEPTYELKVYPAVEQPNRIYSNFIPRKDCGNTNNCVKVEHIEYMPHYEDYKNRRNKRNSKEIGSSEERSNRGKHFLSRLEDKVWQKKIKALEMSFDELLGPPEQST